MARPDRFVKTVAPPTQIPLNPKTTTLAFDIGVPSCQRTATLRLAGVSARLHRYTKPTAPIIAPAQVQKSVNSSSFTAIDSFFA
jgi:hypothetical protein